MKKELIATLLALSSTSAVNAAVVNDDSTLVQLDNLYISETGVVMVENKEAAPITVPKQGAIKDKIKPNPKEVAGDNTVCGLGCDGEFKNPKTDDDKRPELKTPGIIKPEVKPSLPESSIKPSS